MRWAEGFIAVDWGTTNRRAYRIDRDGRGDEFEDSNGVLSVPKNGFDGAVAEIRARLGERPLLLAGMIGSNRGWIEAPYVGCPAAIDDLVRGLAWADEDTAIVPGVSLDDGARADVMRGEEVQLIGAVAAQMIPPDCLVCHPGTHNKWVEMAGGRIAAFRTVMTGELFNLLKEHSILADLLDRDAEPGEPFEAGVRRGLESDDLQAELFSVRARVLLGKSAREDAAPYTSGLLIGGDVRIGLGSPAAPVVVMGRPELTELYAAALAIAGREAVELDGEQCFLAGAKQIAERIE
ncbi:MAG TPA: 2-dehydro-3-deoxygalactonokinase [Sphingomicrobium sp.]|nr:2-dehydro-3-deoxygalactonokinase [Sphingomicrobium sp.]